MIDAHNHFHDERLAPFRAEILTVLDIERAVVNGTREEDWPAVAALAAEHPWALSSFGLHPWYVKERSPRWIESLATALDAHPGAGVGEIGLDRWIEGHDLDDQREVFTTQLALAAEKDRAATIHCIRAWGALDEVLRSSPLTSRGFLIHAYGGPAEMTRGFLDLGAYFSWNAYFLHDRKSEQREIFRTLPAERILIETDAPDLAPPDARNRHPLQDKAGRILNHPANLTLAYESLAQLRGTKIETLTRQVADNFAKLFVQSACRGGL